MRLRQRHCNVKCPCLLCPAAFHLTHLRDFVGLEIAADSCLAYVQHSRSIYRSQLQTTLVATDSRSEERITNKHAITWLISMIEMAKSHTKYTSLHIMSSRHFM